MQLLLDQLYLMPYPSTLRRLRRVLLDLPTWQWGTTSEPNNPVTDA